MVKASGTKMADQGLAILVSPNFQKVLMRNLQSSKNQLHDVAQQVKSALISFIKEQTLSDASALSLLIKLFGPNANQKFSPKRNNDVLKAVTGKISKD